MAETTQLKTLILTESAGKARTIKKFLGRQYLIMSTDGFLKDLPKSRLGIDAENGYAPEYITVRGKSPLLKEIEKAALNARRVYFATNPDAQGEFLAGQLCKMFGVNSKSNCRIDCTDLSKDAFKLAFANARPIDKNLAESFRVRKIIDKFASHKIGEYLSCKIYRGVKVGRFRAMLLKIIAGSQPDEEFDPGKILTPGVLLEIALRDLKFSAPKIRFLLEQFYEGLNFEKDGCGGLITYPHGEKISLSADKRTPDSIKQYLNEGQFQLYDLIYKKISGGDLSEKFNLTGDCTEFSLPVVLQILKINGEEFYPAGISSLLKRNYVKLEDSTFKITDLGKKVLNATEEFFGEFFTVDCCNDIAKKIDEVAAGKIEGQKVIEDFCSEFDKAFNAAMTSLGEDATPKDEPPVMSDEVCEKCGRPMMIRRGRYGLFLSCSGYPECKNAKPYLNYLEQKCPKCGARLAKRTVSRGKIFYGCEKFPTCDFSTWDEPQDKPCKICGATMFIHRFRDRAPIFYCGNENCSSRENHPINKIIAESRKRSETMKNRKKKKAESN